MIDVNLRYKFREIISDQWTGFERNKKKDFIKREQIGKLIKALHAPHAVIISGLRRAGKSTLLTQLAQYIDEKTGANYYYINFEDERLNKFKAEDFNLYFNILVELFGERKCFLIDEIQNIKNWEGFVRRFSDLGYKFIITGSNASLLSKELGTRLTGRHITIELLPFSFREYLIFKKRNLPEQKAVKTHSLSTVESGLLQRELNEYIQLGGIPEVLIYPELDLLQKLYQDVIYRDIVARHKVSLIEELKEISQTLIANSGTSFTFDALRKQTRLKSVNTAKAFVGYLKDSWLICTAGLFSSSIKQQQINYKKTYTIDTGLSRSLGFRSSQDKGHLLETAVFLELKRQGNEIYYYKTKSGFEVDFYLPAKKLFIQVSQTMQNEKTRNREIRVLEEALKEKRGVRGLILTEDRFEEIKIGSNIIEVIPVYEWLCYENG